MLDSQATRHFVSGRSRLDLADIPAASLEANNGTGLSDGFCRDDGSDAFASSHDDHSIADANLSAQGVNERLFIVRDILKRMRNKKARNLGVADFSLSRNWDSGIPDFSNCRKKYANSPPVQISSCTFRQSLEAGSF
jgi:hypothetical protein